ncbi:DUF6519 domain-containing protein [Puia dinghuensis]|uniref:Uncharacterized protein n=1 Tax=Puia dinghuensis TaxID=1792502 RepID=A0A8J2XRD8_9BACT|nr:DUF6519 domain-containing protein [Puia dinghuensis]GGA88612.1 hypothetical protein GCM10011511_09790 [Puia dinghuensis]
MALDTSRNSFVQEKHYSGVLIQQGRVQTDADWNEQWQIERHRTMTEAVDTIGTSGVPKKGGGFKIGAVAGGGDLTISPGRIYVGGLLCELEKTITAATYLHQPYYPDPDLSYFDIAGGGAGGGSASSGSASGSPLSSPPDSPPSSPPVTTLQDGVYLVYLDAWQREVNFHDDPHIHEVALGEADTAIRMQNVWQVKLWQLPQPVSGDVTCDTYFPGWQQKIAGPTGRMNARVVTPANPTNPCVLPPTSGYRGLENQLYRVEVQNGGPLATATFKWSRDNATVETIIDDIDNKTITVADLGRDNATLSFGYGQWVEVVDDESTLDRKPNPLVTIQDITPTPGGMQVLVSDPVEQYNGLAGLKLRRWDQSTNASADGMKMQGGSWIDLENGIQIQFHDGTYCPGDFWMIPARTATGNIEWPPFTPETAASPIAQPPMGVHHYYCRLALIEVSGGVITPQDCRRQFPPLTEIDASDVKFNNSTCDLAGAVNVQEALDQLCAANNMRDHNKYLHGTGVVCGLQVVCGYLRQTVTIKQGYAIDCEGNVIRIKQQATYPIVEASRQYLNGEGSGAVALILNSGTGTPTFSVEKYVKRPFWEEVLEGTLLKDFYDDSVGKLISFIKMQFGSLTPVAPVPVGQRRLTALLNLLAQVLNSASGPYAFLSGVQGTRSDCTGSGVEIQYEDQLLYCLYQDLKTLLTSQTFCGMFDGDRSFPDYTIAPGMQTIFGAPLQTHYRLQISPDGQYAYTSGNGNVVYMYDLASMQLLNILTFPASTSIVIQDIAISPDGTQLVVLGVLNNLDSYFAIATIAAGGTYTWGSTSVACATQFARIGFSPGASAAAAPLSPPAPPSPISLYGTVVTKGFFQISAIGTSAFATKQIGPVFNATGLFSWYQPNGMYIFAAMSDQSGVQTSFDQIIIFAMDPNATLLGGNYQSHPFSGVDAENDLLYSNEYLLVTGNDPGGSGHKALGWILGLEDMIAGPNPFTTLVLNDQNSYNRLAVTGNYLLVTMSDQCKAARLNLNNLSAGSGFRIPVQIYPMAVAVSADGSTGYVLNMFVNTLTVINFSQVFNTSSPPDYTLDPPSTTDSINVYRTGVLDAYQDLLHHLLQFFKDSFCDRFLIDCPTCTPGEKIYLGCVEIRRNRVYKICNFRKRKYVKTFRTVGYWLSTIPIVPVVRESLTRFCCTVMGATSKMK